MSTRNKILIRRLAGPFVMLWVICGLAGGCATSECYDNQNSLPLAGFYSSGKKPQAISVDSLTILGIDAPGDSILQDSVRSLKEVYLPFRLDQNSTTYEIRYLSGLFGEFRIKDVITFNYERIPMFVSTACGAVYYFDMKSIEYTTNLIDSVTCPVGIITNANIENLRIYFRVGEEETP